MLTICYRSGDLKEYIAAGVPKDEFLRRMTVLLESRATSNQPPAAPVTDQEHDSGPTIESHSNVSPLEESLQADNLRTGLVTDIPARPAPTGESNSSAAQGTEQKKLDKGKQKAISQDPKPSPQNDSSSGHQKPSDAEMKYALKLKKQQQAKREERARILKSVEDDKAQRRKLAEERKAAAEKAKAGSEAVETRSSSTVSKTSKQYKECALQIRLFDGSTIRSRFPSSGSLRVDVRPWIDEHQDGNTAYTFKEVLTPLPNRQITISDEEQSLQSQGLTPSATLILVPVQGYTTAYDNSSSSGLVSRGVSAGFGLASWGAGMVTGLVGSLIGGGPAPQSREEQSAQQVAPTNTTPPGSRINVRTLGDQNRQDDQQFYNGNAVSHGKILS